MYTRRRFLTTGGSLAAATILVPTALETALAGAKTFKTGTFPDGVASGDPTPSGITLWTRLGEQEGKGSIRLEVARDKGFSRVVARKDIATSADIGHTAKARIGKLPAGSRFYYRFETAGSHSPVGRFQTAFPSDAREPIRFGVISCQEFTFGYFNAHALLAKEDVDFVINAGDYIYSDVGLDPPIGVRKGNFTTSEGRFSAFTVEEYREHYQRAKSDSNMRKVHATFPMISLWDDHEVQNNYSGGDPSGGAVTGDPYSVERRNNGYKAFFEQMPTFPSKSPFRLYHKASFGKLIDLFVLDERQYRAKNPCGDKAGPACDGLDDPRAFLGSSQLAFAKSGIDKSKAKWKVIANQVVMMPIKLNETDYDGFDAWQGFPVERESLLRVVEDVPNVVFVTGDYHAFIAGDVRTAAGKTVASEFVGGSVTSATEPETNAIIKKEGWGTVEDPKMPDDELARRKAANPWYSELDYLHHGYFTCEASAKQFKTTFVKLKTIRQKSTAVAARKTYTIDSGQRGLK
jgi:alkaline phosphatase D